MWAVLVAGYLAFSRGFAYIGIAPLFIGEAYLGYAILQNTRNWTGRFVSGFLKMRILPLGIGLHLLWGIYEVIRAGFNQRSIIESVRTAAFNYYPLYMLIGVAVGTTLNFPYFLRLLKLVIITYGVRAVIEVMKLDFSQPPNTALIPVIILAMWTELSRWKWRYVLLPLSLYPVFFAGSHGRGTMLGLVAGIIAIAASSPARLLRWGMLAIAFLMVMFVVGPLIPSAGEQAPPLDPVVQAARIIASNHPNFAIKMIKWRLGGRVIKGYQAELDNLVNARGTAEWRQKLWSGAIKSLNTTELQLLGQGEGKSLAGFVPDGQDIHTPHNISIYCIFYTGYIGLAIFFLMLFGMWLTGTRMEDPLLRVLYSSIFWCTLLVAITGNYLETPFGAIPFYLLQGVLIGLDQKIAAYARHVRQMAAEAEYEEWSPRNTRSPVVAY